jgi:O-antigen ligase
MLAIPGVLFLIVFIYARPQEFFDRLQALPFLDIFFALSLIGVAIDMRVGNLKPRSNPLSLWVVLFFGWSAVTVLVRAPRAAPHAIMGLAICVVLYGLIAHGAQTFRALHAVAGAVLAMVLLVSFVGAHQGLAATGCVVVDQSASQDTAAARPDGRPCDSIRSCYTGDAEPGAEYACEHIGLFGTTSIGGGRVRYRGVLQDPNELSLAGAVGLPLAFSLAQSRRRRLAGRALSIVALLLVLVCAVMTGSRGGQLVVLTVLGAYGLKRFGMRGLILGLVLAAPLLLLGGRSGAEADSSTLERLDCWAAALVIGRGHPILGVGLGQFTEHNYMTAHNSYLLAFAELGAVGMILFTTILYLSAKIPLAVLREVSGRSGAVDSEEAASARPWAMALIACFAGLAVGIFFLSFTYHYVFWIYVGMAGALYSAVRTHRPAFRVGIGLLDLVAIVAADVAVLVFAVVYTHMVLR